MNRRPRWLLAPLLASAITLVACGAETPPAETAALADEGEVVVEPGDRAGASRADLAGGETTTPNADQDDEAAMPLLTLTRLENVTGEDGRGAEHVTSAAIAFDLDAHRFPPRASDPVLHVGQLALHRYTHPRIGVLRFVLAEDALPPDGTDVFAQYGDDTETRLALGVISRAAIGAAQ